MVRAVALIALAGAIALPAGLFRGAVGHDILQAQPIADLRQAHCIVPGSQVHKVYRSMLASLRQELTQWDEFKVWSDAETPAMSSSIEIYRQESAARLRQLESAPVCRRAS